MSVFKTVPYGQWLSPISAAIVAQGARPLGQLAIKGADIHFLEGRAMEGGRNTLMRAEAGACVECTPAPFNVRNGVHEYGGGAYLLLDDGIVFSHFADHRLYLRQGESPALPISVGNKLRYADLVCDRRNRQLICVREDHNLSDIQPVNTLCAVALDGSMRETVLVQGRDFYAAPRLSPDGRQLAWLCWNHPAMPWEGCELWIGDIGEDGRVGLSARIAGGPDEAVCQPEWSPEGELYFVSDRSGWWNLYRLRNRETTPVCPMAAEFGSPHWLFDRPMYGFLSAREICCTYIQDGISHLARIDVASGKLSEIETKYSEMHDLRVGPGFVALIAGSPGTAAEVVRIDLAGGATRVLARSIDEPPDAGYISIPESISYPSENGRTAHAFHYPPANRDFRGPEGGKPPLIVVSHGGPTGMAVNTLKLSIQYWTSRGFAVLDVNYAGSSGFGREYRHALRGAWGVVDVEDCVAGARHLAERGMADAARLIIRGGSAGGFTTLSALAFHDVFMAGASYYGVSDLQGLDQDSHKFESHYNHYLIAPPPASLEIYRRRSPANHTDKLRKPMIFFQGLDDKVVPPQQSEVMVAALKSAGVPVAYLAFAGEGHGFRQAANIQRTLEAELYFYAKVFSLQLPEAIEAVHIDNLPD